MNRTDEEYIEYLKDRAYNIKLQFLDGCKDKTCSRCQYRNKPCSKPGYPGSLEFLFWQLIRRSPRKVAVNFVQAHYYDHKDGKIIKELA